MSEESGTRFKDKKIKLIYIILKMQKIKLIYFRKSVEIRFKCTFCNQPMRFTNKCLLRIHLLSHIQSSTERVSIPVQDLEIVSLTQSEPKNKFEDLFLLHRKSMKVVLYNHIFSFLCLFFAKQQSLETFQHFSNFKVSCG